MRVGTKEQKLCAVYPFLLTEPESKWIKFQLSIKFGTLFITLPPRDTFRNTTPIKEIKFLQVKCLSAY